MKKNQTCANCGHDHLFQYVIINGEGVKSYTNICSKKRCPCKKFVAAEKNNQSQETIKEPNSLVQLGAIPNPDALRGTIHSRVPKSEKSSGTETQKGIFDTTELEKTLEGIRQKNTNEDFQSSIIVQNMIRTINHRQRLKAEVEKAIDDIEKLWMGLEELKKRLGIK